MAATASSDVAILWNPATATGDWVISNGTPELGNPLESAVLVSLFTDRVAPVDWVPPTKDTDPRGVWFDTYETSPIGSRLWMLARAKKTDATTILQLAKDYCLEALQWLLDDGVAATLTIRTFWFKPGTLGITVSILKPSGEKFGYAFAWSGL